MFWVWLLVGCPKREPDAAVRRDALLKDADAAWERRGRDGLEAAEAPLLEAYGIAPTFPGVLWRIARLRTAEGMAAEDPDIARSSYAEARATGAACLEGQQGFSERRIEGWGAALTELAADRAPCVVWTAFPWVRWMEIQGGAAAALDLEPVDALLARVADDPSPEIEEVRVWAEGLLLAVRPTWAGQDLEAARTDLERAVELNRKALVPLVDLYRVVERIGTPQEQTELREEILDRDARTPEDIRARATVEAQSSVRRDPKTAD